MALESVVSLGSLALPVSPEGPVVMEAPVSEVPQASRASQARSGNAEALASQAASEPPAQMGSQVQLEPLVSVIKSGC